jgi:hypothetical protein
MSDQHPNREIPAFHSLLGIAFRSSQNDSMPLGRSRSWRSARHRRRARAGSLHIPAVWKELCGIQAPGEQARLQTDVIDENPSLVIWQVGTNAVWKACNFDAVAKAVDTGLKLLLSSRPRMDVVLIGFAIRAGDT